MYNHFDDEFEPKNLWVAEVTNEVHDEKSFAAKEKVFFEVNIHGWERTGHEACTRFIEDLLEGKRPGMEALLDDLALVFLFINPDGTVARKPHLTPGEDVPPEDHLHWKRGNRVVGDTNRQNATAGWVDPGQSYPAEPMGRNLYDDQPGEIDTDVPEHIEAAVPGILGAVVYLRDLENLNWGIDFHNMGPSDPWCLGLKVNAPHQHDEHHAHDEFHRRFAEDVEAELGDLYEANADAIEDAYGFVPDEIYDFGTITDTLGYTTGGALTSWMNQPEETGGLDATTFAVEIPVDPIYDPDVVEVNLRTYQFFIEQLAEYALRTVDADVETGGRSTAYVASDALTRKSADLQWAGTESETTRRVVTVDRRTTVTKVISENVDGLSIHVEADPGEYIHVEIRNPDGRVVARHNPASRTDRGPLEWYTGDPDSGEWTVELQTVKGSSDSRVVIEFDTQMVDGVGSPDPREVFGYEQRAYAVSPLAFFEDYEEFMTAGHGGRRGGGSQPRLKELTVADVRDGALFQGRSDNLRYDNLVVVHDEFDDDEYLRALDQYVEAGGNLVLTDAGVNLLGDLDNDLAAGIFADDTAEILNFSSLLTEKDDEHPLYLGTRPIEVELWRPAPVGYPVDFFGAAPTYGVDPEAFEAAGGTVAGYTHEWVFDPDTPQWATLGTIPHEDDLRTGIHVIGGLLPPANQSEAHPFGLLDYSTSYFGHALLTNALGYEANRYVDGDRVRTLGELVD